MEIDQVTREYLQSKHGFVCDMDGVIYPRQSTFAGRKRIRRMVRE